MTQLQNLLQALHHQNIPPDTLLYAEVISGGKFPSFAPLNWEDVMEHIVDIVKVFLFEQARLFIEQQGQQYLAQRAIEYAIGQARKAKPEWSRFVYQDIE